MLLFIPLFMAAAIPNVRVADHVCGSTIMMQAFHVLRPTLPMQATAPVSPDDLKISLEKVRGLYVVKLTQGDRAIVRSFADPGDCETAGQTAALIADGALDALPPTAPAATLEPPALTPAEETPIRPVNAVPESPPARRWIVSPYVGVGGREAMLGPTVAFSLGLTLVQGLFESELLFEATLPGTQRLGLLDFYLANSLTPILREGVGFDLGPGRLSVHGQAGIELTMLSVQGFSIFKRKPALISEPFGGLRVGYCWNLTPAMFLSASLDERLAFASARFQIEGISAQVQTRTWTLAGAVAFGLHFY